MKKIKLGGRQNSKIRGYAIVEDADFGFLSRFYWHMNGRYAERNIKGGKKQVKIKMHRAIMNAPKGMEVDHINGNPLDNRRENLRICTHAENTRNKVRKNNSSSGFKGVVFHKQTNKWQAQIRTNNKTLYLGLFANKKEAACTYNEKAKVYFGEFARLNKI